MDSAIAGDNEKILVSKLYHHIFNDGKPSTGFIKQQNSLLFYAFYLAQPHHFRAASVNGMVSLPIVKVAFTAYLLTLSRLHFMHYNKN